MSAIFISHSSADSEDASALRIRLEEQGHRSVFLDFDPAVGIPAGRDWERELYRQLRASQAVIVLCSERSMASKWCFAEVTQAKSLGKHLFPIKIGDCDMDALLTSRQVIDLTSDPDQGYERLWRGLLEVGLDPNDTFDWDGSRPPYPGLLAFQEADAAVFFGRDEEIHEGLAELERLWRFGDTAGLVVLGPSGSGKSSFVRAGLLPRLRRDSERWLIVDPFRPGLRPWQALALALAQTFERYGSAQNWHHLRDRLEASAREQNGSILVELATELRYSAGVSEDTRVLLPMDQMEELFGNASGDDLPPFLPTFSSALADPGRGLVVLGTLRSDFLGTLQADPGASDFTFSDLRIGPLAMARIGRVIEGPARIAGIELEAGLSQAMTEDCERGDALPLLAFALRELYERYGQDGLLTGEEYRTHLGGLQGAVARAADDAFARANASEATARTTFLSMVRVTEEGTYARRQAYRDRLPEDAAPLVERFVEARLLVTDAVDGGAVVEVAHEALIRHWDRLRRWVNEDRELILWKQRLGHYLLEWEAAQRDPRALLDGPAFDEAQRWVSERPSDVDERAREFVALSEDRDFLVWKLRFNELAEAWSAVQADPGLEAENGTPLKDAELDEAERLLGDRPGEFGPLEREFLAAAAANRNRRGFFARLPDLSQQASADTWPVGLAFVFIFIGIAGAATFTTTLFTLFDSEMSLRDVMATVALLVTIWVLVRRLRRGGDLATEGPFFALSIGILGLEFFSISQAILDSGEFLLVASVMVILVATRWPRMSGIALATHWLAGGSLLIVEPILGVLMVAPFVLLGAAIIRARGKARSAVELALYWLGLAVIPAGLFVGTADRPSWALAVVSVSILVSGGLIVRLGAVRPSSREVRVFWLGALALVAVVASSLGQGFRIPGLLFLPGIVAMGAWLASRVVRPEPSSA